MFEQFIKMIGITLGVDTREKELEIVYRHPKLTPLGSVKFMPIVIPNDQAMKLMFSIGMSVPNLVYLYITLRNLDENVHNTRETLSQCVDPSHSNDLE